MYHEQCEELSEAKEDIYDYRKENARLEKRSSYPNSREGVKKTLDKFNSDEVIDGNQT